MARLRDVNGYLCANECCTSTFGSFSSPQMSSCSYWKTAEIGRANDNSWPSGSDRWK